MRRREAMALLPAASLVAQPFVGRGLYGVLEQLCDRLLPSEAGSPGAREARVAWYIDTVVKYASPGTQKVWAEGLGRFAPEVTEAMLERESADAGSFFETVFKPLAVEAYCLSREGQMAMGYRGNRALGAFAGCTHEEHR